MNIRCTLLGRHKPEMFGDYDFTYRGEKPPPGSFSMIGTLTKCKRCNKVLDIDFLYGNLNG